MNPSALAEETTDTSSQADRIAIGALLFIIAVICATTWHKWGMLVVDCGREMYVPAALSEGKRLYFDVWYPYGPLIPYWHALLFRIFGIHLSVLYAAGIGMVGVMTGAIYSISRRFLPVSLSFVAAFAFVIQAFQLNLFNYILAYSYPAAYGAFFSTVLVWLLVRDCFQPRPWSMFVAGVVAGLMLLTKIEFGVAGYLILATSITIRAMRSKSMWKLVKDSLLCLPGLLLCLGVYGWLVRASSFAFLFEENIPISPQAYFVRAVGKRWLSGLGFSTSPITLAKSAVSGLLGTAVVLAALGLASASRIGRRLIVVLSLGLCGWHLLAIFVDRILQHGLPKTMMLVAPFFFFNRGMVWVSLVLVVFAGSRWRRIGLTASDSALLLLAASSIALGCRVLTTIEPVGYPIFYDMTVYTAWLISLYLLSRFLPVPPSDSIWRGASVLLCCGLIAITLMYYAVHRRTWLISSSRGSMYTDKWTGEAFSQVLAFLSEAKSRSERFVVLPEEAAFYYFTGTLAPSRWYVLVPGILPPGEPTLAYLADLDRAHIKYVVLSDRATPEYGAAIFGADYNREIYAWLQQNFKIIRKYGMYEQVAQPAHWGALIYERKSVSELTSGDRASP